MAAIRFRIADAAHDREPLVVPQPLQSSHPRVEPKPITQLEHLIRLPTTGATVFNIRTYMAPLAEIAAYPQWAYQLADIVEELPREIAQYKGIDEYRMEAMAWLRERAA